MFELIFTYDLATDTPAAVAEDMVKELAMDPSSTATITSAIEREVGMCPLLIGSSARLQEKEEFLAMHVVKSEGNSCASENENDTGESPELQVVSMQPDESQPPIRNRFLALLNTVEQAVKTAPVLDTSQGPIEQAPTLDHLNATFLLHLAQLHSEYLSHQALLKYSVQAQEVGLGKVQRPILSQDNNKID